MKINLCIGGLNWRLAFAIVSILVFILPSARAGDGIPNPLIDYDGFLQGAASVGQLRQERRVTEEAFIKMAKDPATIVFDARSDAKYQMLHIQGAKHLSLPDVTAAELAKILPGNAVRILIYCNNNFLNSPVALASKAPSTSLNIYTFNTLYGYGYTNVYELGPLIDINTSKLSFEGPQTPAKPR